MNEGAVEKTVEIETPEGTFTIRLSTGDLGYVYPDMVRYTIEVLYGTKLVYTYTINSYEVPPGSLFEAGKVAGIAFARLAHDIRSRPEIYTRRRVFTRPLPKGGAYDVVILQGSPRTFGNSAFAASWCDDEAGRAGLSSRIFSIHDMDIRPCVGCYVCYNEGYCPIDDDMPWIIRAITSASLVVVCTPVYTNTVPAGLKAVMDRCQWLHARVKVLGEEVSARGLTIAVAGQPGGEPFACVTPVVDAFMKNLGIQPAEPVLFSGLDRARDIRKIEGAEDEIRAALRALIGSVAER